MQVGSVVDDAGSGGKQGPHGMPKTCLIPPPQTASEAFLGAERNREISIVTGELLINQYARCIEFKIGVAKSEAGQGIRHIAVLFGWHDEFEQYGKLKKGIIHLNGILAEEPADMVTGYSNLDPIFL